MLMNNFSVTASGNDLLCVLEAKSSVPNIEQDAGGVPVMFGKSRIIDEDFIFMPMHLAKELAIALVRVVHNSERNAGVYANLEPEKQRLWSELSEVIENFQGENNA